MTLSVLRITFKVVTTLVRWSVWCGRRWLFTSSWDWKSRAATTTTRRHDRSRRRRTTTILVRSSTTTSDSRGECAISVDSTPTSCSSPCTAKPFTKASFNLATDIATAEGASGPITPGFALHFPKHLGPTEHRHKLRGMSERVPWLNNGV